MDKWACLIEKINARQLESKTWLSDKKHLLHIIDTCEKLGIDPDYANRATITNLRTIIKPARRAIKAGDTKLLSNLFYLAVKHPYSELKVQLGIRTVDEIHYWRRGKLDEITQYHIEANAKQFEKIRKATKSVFAFQEIENPEK
jgi:hypothetical protein